MKIQNSRELDEAIERLEQKKTLQEGMLSDSFHATVDHFKPANLLRSAFKNITESHDAKSTVLKAAGGLGAGFLAKKLLFGKPASMLGKLAATAVKMGTTNTVLHNTDKISAWGTAIYNNLFKKHHHNGIHHD